MDDGINHNFPGAGGMHHLEMVQERPWTDVSAFSYSLFFLIFMFRNKQDFLPSLHF
jgi:hypothetical protein